ncbi:MAG: LysM peptidoglycan-binding domain-containing protein [Desulfuromonadia bacterium]
MRPLIHLLLCIAILGSTVSPGSGRSYIYRPEPADETAPPPAPRDGVLVKEITIAKGDTLFGLARRHIGRGIYYPQILLFNGIENPDMIYAGDTIRIPVPSTRSVTPPPEPQKRQLPEPVVPAREPKPAPQPTSTPPSRSDEELADLFASAVAAYKKGECRRAVELIDRYLAKHPDTPQSSDLLLYRADCYLSLSGE